MRRLYTLTAAVLFLASPAALIAQDTEHSPQLTRADVSGSIGWVNTDRGDVTDYDDWRTQAGFSIGAGWYWTDHHITRIETTGTTKSTVYMPVPFVTDNRVVYVTTRRRFGGERLGLTQLYQFGRNEWIHPFVGAGVDAVWEHVTTEQEPVLAFDPLTRQPGVAHPGITLGQRTTLTARGVLTAGLKAYVTRRAFASTDLRVGIDRHGAKDTQWRAGFGVDVSR